ncbi:membrane protein [Spirochaetia bacterium]|nr:membrane protein [Spirochaetia bacterium]
MSFLYTLIIYPIVQIIEVVFTFSQKVFREPGVSLIVISGVITLLCLPVYAVAEKWQELERNLQKKFKPKVDTIKNVFKGDEQYMILSAYYRQNHYHPVYALRGSFGLLIQIPFFIAAYSYLSHLEVLKGAPFLFIADLGVPDGDGIHILPIVMTVINCTAGLIYTRGFPVKEKIQLFLMAAVFLVLLYNSPSGLVIYWTMNNCFSLVKNLYYKFNFKWKNTLIALSVSAVCIFLSFYMMRIYTGDIKLRTLFCCLFLMIGIIPWILSPGKALLKKIPVPRYTNTKTLLLFIVSFAAVWIITGLFLPSMLIAASPQEFSYIDSYTTPVFFILNTCLQAAGFFIFWPVCLYFLFSPGAKRVFSLLGPVLLGAAVCNVFFFAGDYGIISMALVFDNAVKHSIVAILVNLGALLIPTAVIVFLFFTGKYRGLIVSAALCLSAVFTFSLYNVFSIQGEFQKLQKYRGSQTDAVLSVEPVFSLSRTGKNTVLIMLDRALNTFLPYILEESPELTDIYSGFVYYPNTVSFNGYTRMGAPPIFGGYEYTPLEMNKRDTVPVVTKHNEALLLMPRIFSEAGYAVTVTDPPYPNYSSKGDLRIYDQYPAVKALLTDSVYTDLWIREHKFPAPSSGSILKRNLLWYGFFRASPLAFRQGIYLQGDWCAPGLLQKITLTLNGYSVLDYLPQLTGITRDGQNTALFMVNNTTHEASFLQAPEYRPALSVTNYGKTPFSKEHTYHVNAAAVKRLADWFVFLKKEQVYDNTRIIVVSDHGTEPNFVTKIGLPFNVDQFNPLLLFKDFDASGSIKTDTTFMSNADVPFLALEGQIENPVNPFTGKIIGTELKENPLYIAISGSIHLENPTDALFVLDPKRDYYVHDTIFDPANWSKAGE